MPSLRQHKQAREQGMTLVVTLIFMVIFLLLVISLIHSSVVNVKVAGNQQHTVEARSAAQQAIEQTISQDFTANPAAAASSVAVDVNGDGTADYVAQASAPVCTSSQPIKDTDLDTTNADDVSCYLGNGNQNTGILTSTASGGNSLCNSTQWDVQASVNDSTTGANVTLHQGVAVRVPVGTTCP
ncbi:pilus assembly protein [Cupriavidus sp. USMAA2-4]|uniref:Pilus assembly protein n=1 Tax=Cupriavidus malaysiensis TaxID=367825 RepID=A0ABM6F1B9_9BURK|nr:MULTISPECIES: pilus assembly PilX N-terminal domain-containing protein [Cupriavidus]AOY91689.1 pilus assembly protein [Cupriavidus sp. USMAA2-4]AOY98754.1 pilus assembly protein [Cupriavidus sp. USMAHM13]AOZ05186.1 pilus assembly protein [Cupriavidus malaysiensis]